MSTVNFLQKPINEHRNASRRSDSRGRNRRLKANKITTKLNRMIHDQQSATKIKMRRNNQMYFMHKIANTRGHAHSNGIEHPHGTKHVDEVKVANGAAIGRHRRVKADMSTVNFIQEPVHGQMIENTRMDIGTTNLGRIGSNSTKHPHGPDHDHDECDREDKRLATKAAGGRLLGACRPSTG